MSARFRWALRRPDDGCTGAQRGFCGGTFACFAVWERGGGDSPLDARRGGEPAFDESRGGEPAFDESRGGVRVLAAPEPCCGGERTP